MQNKTIDEIIINAINCDMENLKDNILSILEQIKSSLLNSFDLLKQCNNIDYKNNNGFIMDYEVVKRIFDLVSKESILFGDVLESTRDDRQKIIYGKEVFGYGNVVIISDGNPYVILEVALRNIMAGNTSIFVNKGYMYGSNNYILGIIETVLEKFGLSKNLVQIYYSDTIEEVLRNYANIDLVISIGDRALQNEVCAKSYNKVLLSGYEYFDLYVEDKEFLNFIDRILRENKNIRLYVREDLNLDYKDAIEVVDIDEAIGQINYTGNCYSSAIFTSSSENASKFIKEVKSNIVTVNTSPTIERVIDIKQEDLVRIKKVIYPLSFNFDGSVYESKA